MCLHEMFMCCQECTKVIEGKCHFMSGPHTWYQFGLTAVSLIQMCYQIAHANSIINAQDKLCSILDTCIVDAPLENAETLANARDQSESLVKEEKILTYIVIAYFVLLFLFLVIFDWLKCEDKIHSSEEFKKNQFKVRQAFKSILQIGFVVLLIRILYTVKDNKTIQEELKQIGCPELSEALKNSGLVFDTKFYTEVLVNLVIFAISICIDYNCLLFPHARSHFLDWEEEQHQREVEEEKIVERNKQKRRGANPENGVIEMQQRMIETKGRTTTYQQRLHNNNMININSDQTSKNPGPFEWPPQGSDQEIYQ